MRSAVTRATHGPCIVGRGEEGLAFRRSGFAVPTTNPLASAQRFFFTHREAPRARYRTDEGKGRWAH